MNINFKKDKFVKSYKITPLSVADIFNLPCIKRVEKMTKGGFYFTTYWEGRAFIGDWLVQREDGTWGVFDDEQYQREAKIKK